MNSFYSVTEKETLTLLKKFREKNRSFYDYSYMNEMKSKSTEELDDPLKTIALRLFLITDKSSSLFQVCMCKIDYIAEAIIHAIEVKNPIALANNTRSLIEHLAALVYVLNELEKLEEKLHNLGQENKINEFIGVTEKIINRAFYGKSSGLLKKANNPENHHKAIHVNDYLKVLKKEFPNVEKSYDFLCEFVHPNYGSNALVSKNIYLNPSQDSNRVVLDALLGQCYSSIQFLDEEIISHNAIFIRLHDLFDYCFTKGAKINNVFSVRKPKPMGDGKSKETAYFFQKARTQFEALKFCHNFLNEQDYDWNSKQTTHDGDKMLAYDKYETNVGDIWFKVKLD